jgi:hypothetical protein
MVANDRNGQARLNPEEAPVSILTRLLQSLVPDACNIVDDINIGSGKLDIGRQS